MDKAFITPKVARPPTVVNRWICVYFYTGFPVDACQLIAPIPCIDIKTREKLWERFARNSTLVPEPKAVIVTPLDEVFMKKVMERIEANIADSEYRIEDLGSDVCMSRMSLYKKIKALTGQTAVEFVRTVRLKRAAQLLRQRQFTVAEVTYEVGFNDLQYFRTCFKKQFGMSPSDYAREYEDSVTLR